MKMLVQFLMLVAVQGLLGQELSFSPDMVFGHRSVTYKHTIGYAFSPKVSINNLTLYDTEYNSDINNIYFIRSGIGLSFGKLMTNLAIGVKNPGAFATFSLGINNSGSRFSYNYSMGTTYQDGFSLEQTLILDYQPRLNDSYLGYVNLLAVGNLNGDGYIRGLQQLKLGIKKQEWIMGLAINLDQFDNSKKRLKNLGFFLKHNF
ncbi:hypothetical protein AB1A65_12275 [Muricauda sp. ANG21]|uniref:hypothetical protein n=1 Tax=Allomuricauda sp. ANG21 TaxID=3042468 RepID=UPI003451A561